MLGIFRCFPRCLWLLIFTVLLSSFLVHSQQSNWFWLNTKPQGNELWRINFVYNYTGFATGGRGIII